MNTLLPTNNVRANVQPRNATYNCMKSVDSVQYKESLVNAKAA